MSPESYKKALATKIKNNTLRNIHVNQIDMYTGVIIKE